MRLVFIHIHNDFSGSPFVLKDIIESTMTLDIDRQLWVGGGSGVLSAFVDRDFGYKLSSVKAISLIRFLVVNVRLSLAIFRQRKDIDVLYLNTTLTCFVGFVGHICGIKTYYHIHEPWIKSKRLTRFTHQLIKLSADKIIVVSDYIATLFGDRSITVLIPPRVRQELLDSSVVSSSDDDKYITMISSNRSYKGIEMFIRLAERKELMNYRFRLILSSSKGDFDVNSRLFHKIDLVINPSDLARFYVESSVVLNLSQPKYWVESFGLTLIEAFSFGTPVIAPNVGGPKSLVKDGVTGVLVDPSDEEQVISAIKEVHREDKYPRYCQRALHESLKYDGKLFRTQILNLFQ